MSDTARDPWNTMKDISGQQAVNTLLSRSDTQVGYTENINQKWKSPELLYQEHTNSPLTPGHKRQCLTWRSLGETSDQNRLSTYFH